MSHTRRLDLTRRAAEAAWHRLARDEIRFLRARDRKEPQLRRDALNVDRDGACGLVCRQQDLEDRVGGGATGAAFQSVRLHHEHCERANVVRAEHQPTIATRDIELGMGQLRVLLRYGRVRTCHLNALYGGGLGHLGVRPDRRANGGDECGRHSHRSTAGQITQHDAACLMSRQCWREHRDRRRARGLQTLPAARARLNVTLEVTPLAVVELAHVVAVDRQHGDVAVAGE